MVRHAVLAGAALLLSSGANAFVPPLVVKPRFGFMSSTARQVSGNGSNCCRSISV